MTTKQFQVGKTYSVRSIGDYDCIFSFPVLARTDKMVTIRVHGKEIKRKVRICDGAECIDPLGRYSMSPVLTAN